MSAFGLRNDGVRGRLAAWLAALGLAAFAPAAGAVSITLVPDALVVTAGGGLAIDVFVAGLEGTGDAQTLRAFDLDVLFDPALLALDDVVFDVHLGEPGLAALVDWKEPVAGVADFAESSLVPAADLRAAQPGAFQLVRLDFTALGPGTADLGFGPVELVGVRGVAIADASLAGARVEIAPIPEPGALLVFGAALFLVSRARR